MAVLVICKYDKDPIKNEIAILRTTFPHYKWMEALWLPRKPKFWSYLPQIHMKPFPYANDTTHKIWSRLANLPQRYLSLNGQEGWRTIAILLSSPCEPSTRELNKWDIQVRQIQCIAYNWASSWENLFLPYANKGTDQPAHPRNQSISAFVICCLDSIIPLLAISKISRL